MTTTPDPKQSDSGPTDNQDSTGSVWDSTFRWTEQRDWIEGSVLLLVLATFWFFGGSWGAIAWIAVASSWVVFPPVVPVGIGQFALIALTPSDGGLSTVLPGSLALLALLVGDVMVKTRDPADGLLFLGAAVIIGGGVLGVVSTSGMGAGVLGVVMIFAAVSYLLHRLLLFKLGHLTTASE
jgi:hypothetical protein